MNGEPLYDPKDIAPEMRQYFEEVETTCGAPWVRVVERTDTPDPSAKGSRFDKGKTAINGQGRTQKGERYIKRAIGWRPSCTCGADAVPAVVLDPFAGAGTTLLVASRLGRSGIGIELNPDYCEMAKARIEADAPLLTRVEILEAP